MDYVAEECRPAASILGKSSVDCSNECPFPFCVVTEAKIIRLELREHLVRIMRRMGNSIDEIAKSMDVTTRSVFRYTSAYKNSGCVQCDLLHSQDVICRSDKYYVVCKDGQYIIILRKHRQATPQELKLVGDFVDYVFPSSIVKKNNNGHDYWVLSRIELEEAKSFERMCDALDRYTLGLNKDVECLQRIT